jgi:hypothetical protein
MEINFHRTEAPRVQPAIRHLGNNLVHKISQIGAIGGPIHRLDTADQSEPAIGIPFAFVPA